MRALNAGGVGKNRDSQPTSGFIVCCQRSDHQVLHTQLRRTVASFGDTHRWYGKWHHLLFAGDNDKVFITRSLNVTSKTTEQHVIVYVVVILKL